MFRDFEIRNYETWKKDIVLIDYSNPISSFNISNVEDLANYPIKQVKLPIIPQIAVLSLDVWYTIINNSAASRTYSHIIEFSNNGIFQDRLILPETVGIASSPTNLAVVRLTADILLGEFFDGNLLTRSNCIIERSASVASGDGGSRHGGLVSGTRWMYTYLRPIAISEQLEVSVYPLSSASTSTQLVTLDAVEIYLTSLATPPVYG